MEMFPCVRFVADSCLKMKQAKTFQTLPDDLSPCWIPYAAYMNLIKKHSFAGPLHFSDLCE